MATLGQELKDLRSEVQEHRVNAVEGNSRTADPNQKGRQNATRFCNYCRTNGHTPSWCRKKIRDEGLKRIENERIAEKKSPLLRIITIIEDQIMDCNNGLEVGNSNEGTTTIITMGLEEIPPIITRIPLPDQTSRMGIIAQTMEDPLINAQTNHLIKTL